MFNISFNYITIMERRDLFLRQAIKALNLHYSKPKHVSYYRLVIGKFLSPYSTNKELRILENMSF